MTETDSAEIVEEEATWEEDENRGTLSLRAVFVLLSGALMMASYLRFSSHNLHNPISIGALNFIIPLGVIWLFFGQGLRPAEWLTDQKYNAWNYGVHFADWKIHLKWAAGIFAVGLIAVALAFGFLPQARDVHFGSNDWSVYFISLLTGWFLVASLVWLIGGYFLFGMAQGFGIIGALIGCVILPFLAVGESFNQPDALLLSPLLIPPLIVMIICWKLKSFAPALYAFLALTPIVLWLMR